MRATLSTRLMVRCLAAVVATVTMSGASAAQTPPNIVLIISDDHGWEDYGFMTHPAVRTPSLDTLASEGLLFTRGYVATGLCRPSLATMSTGLYPHQHGVTGNDPPPSAVRDDMVRVYRRNTTLMSLLGRHGYVSFQTGKWWEGNPLESGFTGAMTHGDPAKAGRHGDKGLTIGREGLQPIYDFIQSAGKKPFFVWYAPMMPHTPHTPPERLLAKYRRRDLPLPIARYYAMVEWFDETVGELLGHLDRQGLRDNTVVLYVADNGWLPAAVAADQPQTRGKLSPYDAGVRTPIMIRWPGHVKPERDDRTLAGSIDLAPTVLRAAGITPPGAMPGLDLRNRRALAERTMIFGSLSAHTTVDLARPAANVKYRNVVRDDGWKLILPYEPNRGVVLRIDGGTADWMRLGPELYNVLDDPRETRNRAAERPGLVAELQSGLDKWWPLSR